MAGSFTLCGIALLISVGLKPRTGRERFLLDLWPKAGCSGKPGHVGEGPGPVWWGVSEAGVSPARKNGDKGQKASRPLVAYIIFCAGVAAPCQSP